MSGRWNSLRKGCRGGLWH